MLLQFWRSTGPFGSIWSVLGAPSPLGLKLGANLVALGANLGPLGANLDALGANLDALGANLDALGANLGAFGPTWRLSRPT